MPSLIAPLQSVTAFGSNEVYCHRGYAYTAFVKATVNTGVTVDVLLTVPANLHVHAQPVFFADSLADVVILEGVTFVSGGSDFTPVNKNRNSSLASAVTAKVGTISVTGGTTIWQEHLGTSKNSGGAAVTEFEWDLKFSTSTLFRITSAANSNIITLAVPWTEPP